MTIFVDASQNVRQPAYSDKKSEVVTPEDQTFMGYVKSLIHAIEIWHLNMLATFLVAVFVYWQFRSMFVARLRPKQQKHESFNASKPVKKKEFADKQVRFIN